MAQRELETKSSVWNTGLQDIPMLLCSCFFSNLLTEMLKYITISLWNEEGLRPIAEYNWIFSLSRKQPELNWRMSQPLSHSQEQTHSHFMRMLHYASAHRAWFSVLLEAVPSVHVFILQHWWWWWWWWWFRYKTWNFLTNIYYYKSVLHNLLWNWVLFLYNTSQNPSKKWQIRSHDLSFIWFSIVLPLRQDFVRG